MITTDYISFSHTDKHQLPLELRGRIMPPKRILRLPNSSSPDYLLEAAKQMCLRNGSEYLSEAECEKLLTDPEVRRGVLLTIPRCQILEVQTQVS